MALWIADYRPDWIGYVNSTRQLMVVKPDGEGGTASSTASVTFDNYHFPPTGPADKLVATWNDKTGRIGTVVLMPGTQTQFNAMLSEWQRQLSAVAPCAAGVAGHDATVIFSGANARAWCGTVSGSQGMEPRAVGSTTRMDQLCTVKVSGATATVQDTGGHVYGSELCSNLQLLGDMPPTGWQATITTIGGVADLKDTTAQLQKLAKDLGQYPAKEQAILETMKQHLKKEKDHAAVRPMTDYQANSTVQYDYESTLGYDFNSSLSYQRDNLTSEVSDLDTVLSEGNIRLAIVQENSSAAARIVGHPLDYAQTAIAAYQGAVTDAQGQKAAVLAADADVLKAAKDIMAEGQAVLNAARAAIKQ